MQADITAAAPLVLTFSAFMRCLVAPTDVPTLPEPEVTESTWGAWDEAVEAWHLAPDQVCQSSR